MISNLGRMTFAEIVEGNREDTYLEDDPNTQEVHRYSLTNGNLYSKFAYLKCRDCGRDRAIINPQYLNHYIAEVEETLNEQQRLRDKEPDPVTYSGIDRDNIRRGLESFEGDVARALLQPYHADGTPNVEFYKTYGRKNLRV